MSAIITDQIRILNAKNFISGITTSDNSYYAFVGLPNPTSIQSDWDNDPPAPIDNFNDVAFILNFEIQKLFSRFILKPKI